MGAGPRKEVYGGRLAKDAGPCVKITHRRIPAFQTVSQLAKKQMWFFCHSGLDPESIAISGAYFSGCRIRSGMTVANQAFLQFATQSHMRASSFCCKIFLDSCFCGNDVLDMKKFPNSQSE
jgi:hypothetical protein